MTNWYDEVDKIYKDDSENPEMKPASEFDPDEECIELLTHFEGFSATSYVDPVGVITIGHGFTKGVKMGDTITFEESVKRKLREVDEHWKGIQSHINSPISQGICNALASWAYNVGVGAARQSTLLKKLNLKDYEGAADELLRWDKAGGRTLAGLTRRRKAEREMFLNRDWTKFKI